MDNHVRVSNPNVFFSKPNLKILIPIHSSFCYGLLA